MPMQLLEERDADLERSEASLEGHKKAADVREEVSTLCPRCIKAKRCCSLQLFLCVCMTGRSLLQSLVQVDRVWYRCL